MTKAQIQGRLEEIDHLVEALEEERETLAERQEVYDKWTPAATERKLRAKVLATFGPHHKIKLAVFKANSEYNDEGYDHNPCLILIDHTYNEVDHKISLWDMTPNDDDKHEYYDVCDEDIQVEDVTVKF